MKSSWLLLMVPFIETISLRQTHKCKKMPDVWLWGGRGGVRWFPLSQSGLYAFVHFFLGPQSCERTWVSWFKGIDPQKQILLLKPYILDNYGVSHSSFWSEGPKNHLKFGFKVCPPGPRGGRTSDFEGQRQGTLRCATWTSNGGAIGPRWAAHGPWGGDNVHV